jgi:hypothetical protein
MHAFLFGNKGMPFGEPTLGLGAGMVKAMLEVIAELAEQRGHVMRDARYAQYALPTWWQSEWPSWGASAFDPPIGRSNPNIRKTRRQALHGVDLEILSRILRRRRH